MKTNLLLTGFMGAGKTTVGQLLAKQLGLAFADTDEMVEALLGKSAEEIFAADGEAAFRSGEQTVCNMLAERQETVIACGGATLLNETNAAQLRKNGVNLFLDTDFSVCYERVKNSGRPLVKACTKNELAALFLQRRPNYLAVSDGVILCGEDSPEQTAQRAAELFFAQR